MNANDASEQNVPYACRVFKTKTKRNLQCRYEHIYYTVKSTTIPESYCKDSQTDRPCTTAPKNERIK